MKHETQPYPYMPDQPDEPTRDPEDARLECWFCPGEPAVALAPRHSGGDLNVPAHYIPVCEGHAREWHEDTPEDERLPLIPRFVLGRIDHAAGE